MKYIDIEHWERKDHFNYFRTYDSPHFSISGNVDATAFLAYIKEHRLPFFISMLYAASKVANEIREFRFRIQEDKLAEYDAVHPSCTVMTASGAFSYCTLEYTEAYAGFRSESAVRIEHAKHEADIDVDYGRDDLLYITSIPWVSFTGITHAMKTHPADSIPRIAWGKYFENGEKTMLPLSVSANHALVDGLHVGRYFNMLQDLLDSPEKWLI
ncbi:MAG: chloramphenicol acetyltransferase [Clostridiales bacterium]|nr:chloramphenicol acetyltransferase [Clostridiales bacterium]